jgi:hypothetical protein
MKYKSPKCDVPGCKNPGNYSSALNKETDKLMNFCQECTFIFRTQIQSAGCSNCRFGAHGAEHKQHLCTSYGDGDIKCCGKWQKLDKRDYYKTAIYNGKCVSVQHMNDGSYNIKFINGRNRFNVDESKLSNLVL